MERLREILNNPLHRLAFGLMIAGTIACPYINGYSESLAWVVFGILFMCLVITTVIGKWEFTPRNQWIIFLVLAFVVALCWVIVGMD